MPAATFAEPFHVAPASVLRWTVESVPATMVSPFAHVEYMFAAGTSRTRVHCAWTGAARVSSARTRTSDRAASGTGGAPGSRGRLRPGHRVDARGARALEPFSWASRRAFEPSRAPAG